MKKNDLAVEGWGEKETCTKGVSNCQKEGDWVKQYRELMLFCCVGVYSWCHSLTNFWLFFLDSDSVLSCCAFGSCNGSPLVRAFHVEGLRYHAPYLTFTQLGVYLVLAYKQISRSTSSMIFFLSKTFSYKKFMCVLKLNVKLRKIMNTLIWILNITSCTVNKSITTRKTGILQHN